MEAKTKFLIVYALLAVLAVVAVGTGYETVKLKQKVDKIPTPLTQVQVVEKAMSDQYNAYFTQNKTPATVDDSTSVCVKTSDTKFLCSMHLVNTSTGQKVTQKLTVTYDGTKITNVVTAK